LHSGKVFPADGTGPEFKTWVRTFLPNKKNALWKALVVRTTSEDPWSKSTSADGSKGDDKKHPYAVKIKQTSSVS
jgi:hypothetical protein